MTRSAQTDNRSFYFLVFAERISFKINLNILTEAHKFSWFKINGSLRSVMQGCNLLPVNPGRITRKQSIFDITGIFVSDYVCDFKD